jgi:HEAT repeat protein
MHRQPASRGIPLPSVWQLLIAVAAVCAGWLIWSENRGQEAARPFEKTAKELAGESGQHTLRSIEALEKEGAAGIAELKRLLDSPDAKIRQYSLMALRRIGPAADAALDTIRERLSDDDGGVREQAVDAYWQIRRDAIPVAQALAASLTDREERVRTAAINVFVSLGPPAIPDIIETLQGDGGSNPLVALTALRRIGWDESRNDISEALRKFAGHADSEARTAALSALAQWGQPTSAEIRELLKQPDPPAPRSPDRVDVRARPQITALRVVYERGPGAAENLPDVMELLRDDMLGPNHLVLAALRSMKSAALPAVPHLLESFDADKSPRRWDVCHTLIHIGADRQQVIDRLIPVVTGSFVDDLADAGRLLAYASPEEGRRQVAALIAKLSSVPRDQAAQLALWGLGSVAQEAVPLLKSLLEQPLDHYGYWRVARILGEIGPDAAPAVPGLLRLLGRQHATIDNSIQDEIIESLVQIHPDPNSVVPALLAELALLSESASKRDENSPVQQQHSRRSLPMLIFALKELGGADPKVLAALRQQLTRGDGDATRAAFAVLVELTPDSPDVLAELLKQRPPGRNASRPFWIYAITRMTCDRQSAIAPLSDALRDSQPGARKLAARALGMLGPQAKSALPALNDALSDWQNTLYEPRNTPENWYHADSVFELRAGRRRISNMILNEQWEGLPDFDGLSVCDVVREAIAKIDESSHLAPRSAR